MYRNLDYFTAIDNLIFTFPTFTSKDKIEIFMIQASGDISKDINIIRVSN